MRNLLTIILFAASFTTATNAVAFEKLSCESENVKIVGNLKTRYIGMGHSTFSGDLTVFFYDRRKIVDSVKIKVFNGNIQDSISMNTSIARTESDEQAKLNIEFDRHSTLQIGSEKIQFQPHCEIK